MDLELSGKTVLVTGGSKGIGLAVAEVLAAEGCHLHLVARTAERLDEAKAKLHANHGAEVAVHPLDLSQSGSVDALMNACPDVDIVVNNAGAIPAGTIESIDESRWREAWDLKVYGYINMTRAYYARMKARGGGVILNVIGMAGEKMDAGYVAGSTGNASLMAFTRAVGGLSLDDNIRVLAVNPGAVETDRIVTLYRSKAEAEFGDAERYREFFDALPMQRAATATEVAELVAFLVSPRASYICGTVVTIDGGWANRGKI